MSITQLKKRGWVTEDKNKFLLLTDEGNSIARLVEQNFNVLSQFFQEVLGVSKDVALGDACKMEHLMSLETGRRLVWLMRYILSDESRAAEVHEVMSSIAKGCDDIESCPICADVGGCLAKPKSARAAT